MRKKQQGFALIAGMLIVIAVISTGTVYFSQYMAKQRVIKNTESFFNRVVYLRTQIHAYANDHYLQGYDINSPNIFPARLSDLEGGYVPACTTTNNKNGLCMKVNQTPWGEIGTRDYRRALVTSPSGANYYRAELDLYLPDKGDPAYKSELSTTISLFSQMPNIVYDEDKNMITVRVDRPDKAFAYEGLVKRSGDDSTLLGDWDIGGNYAVTNAKDFTIRNSDGTQTLISRGLVNVLLIDNKTKVIKPSCPVGTEPKFVLSIASMDMDANKYSFGGKVITYFNEKESTDDYWLFGLDILAYDNRTNKAVVLHSGKIQATIFCG